MGLKWIKTNKKLNKITENIYQIKFVDNIKEDTNKFISGLPSNFEMILKEYRKEKAKENNLELYQIFPNKTILSLLTTPIKDISDFNKINGLGKKRIEKYGNDILKIINGQKIQATV